MVVTLVEPVRTRRRPVSFREARNALLQLRRCTRLELAEQLGCSPGTARLVMNGLVDRGLARDSGEKAPARGGKQGRPAPIFEFVPPRERADYVPDKLPEKRPALAVAPPRAVQAVAGVSKTKRRKSVMDEARKVADELGYTLSLTKKGHLRFDKPGSAPIFSSGTPSDWRTVKNTIADLRAAA